MDVLLLDDEKDFEEMFAWPLGQAGHRVSRVYDGRQALEFVAVHEPEVVILDSKMPGPDGLQILDIIKDRHPL